MIYEQIVTQGRARALDFGSDWPGTDSVLHRRIEIRQQELFTAANRANPDYFGVNVIGVLNNSGDVVLSDLDVEGSAIDPTSSITRVEIQDPGTHPTLARGDEVAIVPHNDPDAGVAPRMTLRNFTLHPYCDDMDGVVSVCIFYGYRPAPLTMPIDGSTADSELPSVFDELLVLDITRFLLKMTVSMEPATKTAALELIGQEMEAMETAFLGEVVDYAGGQVSRFGSVVGGQRT